MIGTWPIASEAIAGIPAPYDASTPSPVPIFVRSPGSELTYLLVARPLDPLRGAGASDYPYALGEEAIGGLASSEGSADPAEVVYLGNVPYRTGAADDPAEVQFEPRLLSPFNFESSIADPGGADGTRRAAFGAIRVNNADRELDYLINWAWEHRELLLLVGGVENPGRWNERELPLDEYWPMRLRCAGLVDGGSGTIDLQIQDAALKVSETLEVGEYGGTGGLDGDENLAGRKRPICLGIVRNGEAVPVDTGYLVYQIHDGSIEEILAVRDKGVELTPAGDIASLGLSSVYDWVDVPGSYVTDLANGILRLGAKPTGGRVTFDAKGDNTGGYVESTPDVVRRIAVDYGGLSSDDIDPEGFAAFTVTGPVGYYTGLSDPNTLALIDGLMAGADGFATFQRDGTLAIGQYADPTRGQPVASVSGEEVNSVSSENARAPFWRVSVAYRRNWVVQSGDDLAAAVSEDDRLEFGLRHRVATMENLVAKGSFRDAGELTLESFFDLEADALEVCEGVISRHARRRRRYSVRVEDWIFLRSLGEIVNVDTDRGGLSGGRNLLVLSVAENAPDRSADLVLWG